MSSLRSVTYVSEITDEMSDADFLQLGVTAARLNALDGITGLLVFNGRRFCQTVEGSSDALDHLLGRLKQDPRHDSIQVIEDQPIDARRFRSWDMQLLSVPADREEALEVARSRLDSEADVAARKKIYEIVAAASA